MKKIFSFALFFCIAICSKSQHFDLVLQSPHTNPVEQIYFSKDGSLFYTVSSGDKSLKIWESINGKLIKSIHINSSQDIDIYPSKNDAAYMTYYEGDSCRIAFIDKKGNILNKINYPKEAILINEENSGKLIIKFYEEHRYEVWDIETGNKIFSDSYEYSFQYQYSKTIEKRAGTFWTENGYCAKLIQDSVVCFYDLNQEKPLDTVILKTWGVNVWRDKYCHMYGKNKLLFERNDSLLSMDLKEKTLQFVYKSRLPLTNFYLSPNNSYLLMEQGDSIVCITLNNATGKEGKFLFSLAGKLDRSFAFNNNAIFKYKTGNYPYQKEFIYNIDSITNFKVSEKDIYETSVDGSFIAVCKFMDKSVITTPTIGNPANCIQLIPMGKTFSNNRLIKPDNEAVITAIGINNIQKKIIVSGENKSDRTQILWQYDFTGKLRWEVSNKKNENQFWDDFTTLEQHDSAHILSHNYNTGLQYWDISKGIIEFAKPEAKLFCWSNDTLNYLVEKDSSYELYRYSISKQSVLDSMTVCEKIPYNFIISLVRRPGSNEFILITSFNIFKIDFSSHVSRKFDMPQGVFPESNTKAHFYNKNTLIIQPLLSADNVALDLSNKDIIPLHKNQIYAKPNISPDKTFYCSIENRTKDFEKPDCRINIFSTENNRLLQQLPLPIQTDIINSHWGNDPVQISADSRKLLLQTQNALIIYKADEKNSFKILYKNTPLFLEFYDAVISADSKFVYYSSSDGVIRSVNLDNGFSSELNIHTDYPITRLLPFIDGRFLILSTKKLFSVFDLESNQLLSTSILSGDDLCQTVLYNNYYRLSDKTSDLIGFTQWPHYIPFDQLDVQYNRPDKVMEILGSRWKNTDTISVNNYHKAWQKRIRKLGIDTSGFSGRISFPVGDIENRDSIPYEQNSKDGILELSLMASDSVYNLDKFNIWINNVPVFGQKGNQIKTDNKKIFKTRLSVQLSTGENKIEMSVINEKGIESYRTPLYVHYNPSNSNPSKVFFLGIGIDKYKQSKYNLQYSAKDIRDLSDSLQKRYGTQLETHILLDTEASGMNIKTLKSFLKNSQVNDKVILAFSGHGLLGKKYDYYLSTHEVDFENPETGGLLYDELENILDSIPARQKLMLIDACHSGELDKDEIISINRYIDSTSKATHSNKGVIIVNEETEKNVKWKNAFEMMQETFANVSRGTGATIIAASGGTQFAQENGTLKNGVFSYSILELMKQEKNVTVSKLKKHVGKRVEELTGGFQKPTSRNENITNDWIIW